MIKSDEHVFDENGANGVIQIANQESAQKPASFMETKMGAGLAASANLVSSDLQIEND